MEDNSLLPHDIWKSARKSLVKLSVSDGETHVTRRKTLLNSLHKDEVKFKQFKSSIILLNSMNRHKSKTDCSVLPSVIKLKRQRIIRLPSQDDLWKSIKSNYFYLMDNNLVDECQKTSKELSLHSPSSSPVPFTHQPISFPEFVERFNALHDRLHQLLLFLQDDTKQHNFIELQSEMDLLGCENEFLCDQATILQRLDPELKDDVGRRCTILKNKWDVLTSALWPKKKQEKDLTTKSLTADVRTFRKWLREVEERLRRMKVTDMSSADEIRNLYNEEKNNRSHQSIRRK